MFDELTKGRKLYGNVANNGRFPDWNAVNMSALTLFTVIPAAVQPTDTPHSSWM